jgi:hypothetical protein
LHSKGTVELSSQTKPTEVSCADTQFAAQIVYGTGTLQMKFRRVQYNQGSYEVCAYLLRYGKSIYDKTFIEKKYDNVWGWFHYS